MEIERQPILKRFFYSTFVLNHKIFSKSVSCDRTCTHDGSVATFAATCHIKKSLDFVFKKMCMISTAIVRKDLEI